MYNGKTFNISFNFLKKVSLKNRNRLKEFIAQQLFLYRKKSCHINYIFCSDEELLRINRIHLKHDYYTDIVTFELSDSDSDFLVSDIYISTDRVKDNANILKSSFNRELHRVIFHGILHLIGYKDKSDKEAKQMREKEDEWLSRYNK